MTGTPSWYMTRSRTPSLDRGDFDEPDHMANAVGVTWGG